MRAGRSPGAGSSGLGAPRARLGAAGRLQVRFLSPGFGRPLGRSYSAPAAWSCLRAAGSGSSPRLGPGAWSPGAAAASRQAWGARVGGGLQADPWGERSTSCGPGKLGSQGPGSGTLPAGGAIICRVTGFPRIVGCLWRGVGRRRGPRRGSGIGSPPGSRTGGMSS